MVLMKGWWDPGQSRGKMGLLLLQREPRSTDKTHSKESKNGSLNIYVIQGKVLEITEKTKTFHFWVSANFFISLKMI